jgi:beta-lactam-binding protein with PASTA domain
LSKIMNYSLYVFIPFIAFLAGFGLISFFVHEKSLKTPALLGHSVTYALRQATDQGFTLKILAEKEAPETTPGTILAQKPVPGALIKPKQAVFITIAKAPNQSNIPDFTGLQEAKWQQKAAQDALFIKTFPLIHHAPLGTVIAQSPEAGLAYDNQTVKLLVSSGPQTKRIMPDLTGQDSVIAQEFLENYGITVSLFKESYDFKKYRDFLPGTIIAQKPLPGSWIDLKKPLLVQLVVLFSH